MPRAVETRAMPTHQMPTTTMIAEARDFRKVARIFLCPTSKVSRAHLQKEKDSSVDRMREKGPTVSVGSSALLGGSYIWTVALRISNTPQPQINFHWLPGRRIKPRARLLSNRLT